MKSNNLSRLDLPIPTVEECSKYIRIWADKYSTEFNGNYDKELILHWLFTDYNHSNKVYKEMLIKVVAMNSVYCLKIRDVEGLVKHLLTKIDSFSDRLEHGDPELVNDIKSANTSKVYIDTYLCFASRYCNKYNPEQYPIYDPIIRMVLEYYNHQFHFYHNEIDWTDYVCYKKVVDAFIEKFSFIRDYTMLYYYLWTMGNELHIR